MHVNEQYLEQATLEQMQDFYVAQQPLPHILLQNILKTQSYEKTFLVAQESEFEEIYEPLTHRRAEAINEKIQALVNSDECKRIINNVLGKQVQEIKGKLHLFAHTMYQLLDADKGVEKHLVFLDLTPLWDESWGASLVWKHPDGESFTLPTVGNSMFIVSRPAEWKHYISYCNNNAGEYAKVLFVGEIITK